MYIYIYHIHIHVHIPYTYTCISCAFSETSKKEIDIITIPDGSLTLVHEPKTKVDLTKYLEHHKFK